MKMLIFIAAFFIGCDASDARNPHPPSDPIVVDQCLRREIFKECLGLLPKGPDKIDNSNDWDEVVQKCESSAYYQSMRLSSVVSKQCTAGGR